MKFNSKLSNENNLILSSSFRKLNPERISQIKNLLKSDLDWPLILKKAHFNKVTPFLYKTFEGLYPECNIPEEIFQSLKKEYTRSTFINMKWCWDLDKILKALEISGTKIILIKGASLWVTVYKEDPTLRIMGDIDMIVKKDDWQNVLKIFCDYGYFLDDKEYFEPRQSYPLEVDYHNSFRNKNDTRVEIKPYIWGLDFPDSKRDDLWDISSNYGTNRKSALIPPPEYLIIIACTGLVDHNFKELIWFCDINEIIDHYKKELDWKKLIALTKEKNMNVPIYYGLLFTRQLLQSEIPDFVFSSLNPVLSKKGYLKFCGIKMLY